MDYQIQPPAKSLIEHNYSIPLIWTKRGVLCANNIFPPLDLDAGSVLRCILGDWYFILMHTKRQR